MRNVTLFSFLLATLFSATTVVGQTYDLAVTAVATASNPSNEIPAGMVAPISLTIANNGSNDIPTGTEFWVAIEVNGTYFINPDTFVLTGAFGAGAEATLTSTTGYSFEGSTPNYEICGEAFFSNTALEANANNNTFCDDFLASSGAHNDWAALSVSIEEPTNLDGFDLDNETNTVPDLDSVVLILQNNSNITFPGFYGVNYQLALDGDTTNVTGFLGAPLAPGEMTTRIVSNAAVLPTMAQDSGTYDFCVIVVEEGDNVDSNDVTCESFTIIDSYDPFNPANWPLGQEEVAGKTLKVVPLLDAVDIQGVSNGTRVTLTDMSGRIIRKMNITEDTRIDMNDEKSGVYIIQAEDNSGSMEIKKFSKQ